MVGGRVLGGEQWVGGGGEGRIVGVVVGRGVDELVLRLAGRQQAGRGRAGAVEQAGAGAGRGRHARGQDERRTQRRRRAQRHAARRQQALRLGRRRCHAPPLLVRCRVVFIVLMLS